MRRLRWLLAPLAAAALVLAAPGLAHADPDPDGNPTIQDQMTAAIKAYQADREKGRRSLAVAR